MRNRWDIARPPRLGASMPRRSFLALATFPLVASRGPRAEAQEDPPKDEKSDVLATMRTMARAIQLCEVQGGMAGAPVPLREEPILHYSDPTRAIQDASLWAWGAKGRPLAVMKVEYQPIRPGDRRWVEGVASLAPGPIAVEFHDGQRWEAKKAGIELRAIPKAPAPANSESLRLSQMKALARRFAASEYAGPAKGRIQLRLMPSPLLRYADPDAGLRDGALFGFAYGTNPDVLFVIEARSLDGSPASWHYGFARQGGGQLYGNLDDQEIWSEPTTADPPAVRETYMNRRVAAGAEPK
jgi:hypothetical protein